MQRNALLSVYNKTGVIEFAQALVELGFRLFASGGTCRHLAEAGLSVTDVKDLVGGEAILGHKVVTLSRELHAGLLADYIEKDLGEMERLGLPYMDLVAVDLYPLPIAGSYYEARRYRRVSTPTNRHWRPHHAQSGCQGASDCRFGTGPL